MTGRHYSRSARLPVLEGGQRDGDSAVMVGAPTRLKARDEAVAAAGEARKVEEQGAFFPDRHGVWGEGEV
jgi:hypothetical protein